MSRFLASLAQSLYQNLPWRWDEWRTRTAEDYHTPDGVVARAKEVWG